MKKAEAISILATSVRPREAKDRARYDEAVKMAIEALKCSETPKSSERTSETAQADHIADIGKKVDGDCISRQWLMECVSEGWIKFDTEKDENKFIHLVRDIAPSAQPERKKDIIQKFHDYQVEWLTNHYDLEFEPTLENLVVRFLHDTANCFMMEMDRGEQDG